MNLIAPIDGAAAIAHVLLDLRRRLARDSPTASSICPKERLTIQPIFCSTCGTVPAGYSCALACGRQQVREKQQRVWRSGSQRAAAAKSVSVAGRHAWRQQRVGYAYNDLVVLEHRAAPIVAATTWLVAEPNATPTRPAASSTSLVCVLHLRRGEAAGVPLMRKLRGATTISSHWF